jgi:hypothetical protein
MQSLIIIIDDHSYFDRWNITVLQRQKYTADENIVSKLDALLIKSEIGNFVKEINPKIKMTSWEKSKADFIHASIPNIPLNFNSDTLPIEFAKFAAKNLEFPAYNKQIYIRFNLDWYRLHGHNLGDGLFVEQLTNFDSILQQIENNPV